MLLARSILSILTSVHRNKCLGEISRLGLWNTLTASLQKDKTSSPNKCPGYDVKKSDGEIPVMLELWEMPGTPSLPLLPGSLWSGVVALEKVLSMGQIELFSI